VDDSHVMKTSETASKLTHKNFTVPKDLILFPIFSNICNDSNERQNCSAYIWNDYKHLQL